MKFLPPGFNTKEIEMEVKNKWQSEWLNKRDLSGERYGEWLSKPDVMGVSFCKLSVNSKTET